MGFFVRSAESVPCPICAGPLRPVGSRKRTRRLTTGVRMVLVIRRLGCPACDRIHHELPDCLVPYKRYDVESIEAGILAGTASAVAADESTIARWRRWFATWVCLVNRKWLFRTFGVSLIRCRNLAV